MIELLANLNQIEKFFLSILGAVFAFVGLYMMIKPSARDEQTRIEIFGLKFNASSGGVLVFITGSCFLIVTALAPESLSPAPSSTTQAATKSEEIDRLNIDLEDHKKTVSDLNKKLKRRDDEFITLEAQAEKLKSDITAKENEIGFLKSDLEYQKRTVNALQKEVHFLKNKISKTEGDLTNKENKPPIRPQTGTVH